MKNFNSKILYTAVLLFSATFLWYSCDDDDLTGYSTISPANSILNITLDAPNSETFVEEDRTYTFTATLSEPQIVDVPVYVEQVSGTADENDVSLPHDLIIPAGSLSLTSTIEVFRDLEPEDTETAVIQIGTGDESNVVVNGQTLTLTLQDYVFCTWTLVTSDTYGDGWNGGYVSVDVDGTVTDYAAAGSGTTFEISIQDGASYSFSYVSGGGGFCGAPGYECENYFMLTAPDGTSWEEGSMDYSGAPTECMITSGTNNCP